MKILLFAMLSLAFFFAPVDADAGRHGFGGGYHFSSQKKKTYQVYKKVNLKTGKTYIGRTSGTKSAIKNVKHRDANHHRNKDGYGPAEVTHSSKNKDAIRGQEQREIEYHQKNGDAADQINSISARNKKRDYYIKEAIREFGND